MLAAFVERLPPRWRPARAGGRGRVYMVAGRRRGVVTVEVDGARIIRTRRVQMALDAFESDVHQHVAEWAPRFAFVHAGVVGWRGSAILVPGRSMSGKTTLVKALLVEGATYYSDEYAVLDRRGRVHPFARHLRLRTEAWKSERHDPAILSHAIGKRALPVGLVVISRYREGARWRPRRLSPAEGALALMANTVSARRAPERALTALQAVVLGATIVKGTRGEAADAARALMQVASSPPMRGLKDSGSLGVMVSAGPRGRAFGRRGTRQSNSRPALTGAK
jgi:hypothetical protein